MFIAVVQHFVEAVPKTRSLFITAIVFFRQFTYNGESGLVLRLSRHHSLVRAWAIKVVLGSWLYLGNKLLVCVTLPLDKLNFSFTFVNDGMVRYFRAALQVRQIDQGNDLMN